MTRLAQSPELGLELTMDLQEFQKGIMNPWKMEKSY